MYDKHFKYISILKYKLIFITTYQWWTLLFLKLTMKMRKINGLGDAIKQIYDTVGNNLVLSQVK